jgi:mono/diheme cytochrome c family protein
MTELAQHTITRTNPPPAAAMPRRRALLLAVTTAAIVGAGAVEAIAADEGAKLYATLCAACHGVSGRGDGPAAGAMTPPPTDLTQSTLKVPELMKVIDGRRTVRAHGSSAMPVWGRVFEEEMAGGGREHRDSLRQTQMLAEYVQSLEKPAAR